MKCGISKRFFFNSLMKPSNNVHASVFSSQEQLNVVAHESSKMRLIVLTLLLTFSVVFSAFSSV